MPANLASEEHHINEADASSFFVLHDFDADGNWEPMEIRQTYGLEDESSHHVPESKKLEVVQQVLDLLDLDHDGRVTATEFQQAFDDGKRLPDFGVSTTRNIQDLLTNCSSALAITATTNTSTRYTTGRNITTRTPGTRT